MASLYNLTADWQKVVSMMYDDDVDIETVIDTADSIEAEIEDKADGYAMVLKQIDSDVYAIDAEIKRLRERKAHLENKSNRLKNNLQETMKTLGKTKFKTPLFSFGIQKNGGKRALILDVEPDQLPHTLRTIQYVANNDAIREFMGSEESCVFAHLAEQGESLRIS